MQAMNQLHPDVVAEVQSRALYSTEEESLMGTVSSVRLHTTYACSSHMNERYTHVIPFKSQPLKVRVIVSFTHYSDYIDLYWSLMDIYLYRFQLKFTLYSDSELKKLVKIFFLHLRHYQATLLSLILYELF